MVASGFIPGSPLARVCDEKGKVLKFAPAFYLIFIWTALDVVAHLAMTIFLLRKDRSMGISRSWLCPIVPILPANSVSDLEVLRNNFKNTTNKQWFHVLFFCLLLRDLLREK